MTDLLYGRNAVREALRAGRKVMRLLIAEPAPQRAAPPPAGKRGAPAGRPGGQVSAPGRPPARGGKGAPQRPGLPGERPRVLPVEPTRADRRTITLAGRAP